MVDAHKEASTHPHAPLSHQSSNISHCPHCGITVPSSESVVSPKGRSKTVRQQMSPYSMEWSSVAAGSSRPISPPPPTSTFPCIPRNGTNHIALAVTTVATTHPIKSASLHPHPSSRCLLALQLLGQLITLTEPQILQSNAAISIYAHRTVELHKFLGDILNDPIVVDATRKARVRILTEVDTCLPEYVQFDVSRIGHILANIILFTVRVFSGIVGGRLMIVAQHNPNIVAPGTTTVNFSVTQLGTGFSRDQIHLLRDYDAVSGAVYDEAFTPIAMLPNHDRRLSTHAVFSARPCSFSGSHHAHSTGGLPPATSHRTPHPEWHEYDLESSGGDAARGAEDDDVEAGEDSDTFLVGDTESSSLGGPRAGRSSVCCSIASCRKLPGMMSTDPTRFNAEVMGLVATHNLVRVTSGLLTCLSNERNVQFCLSIPVTRPHEADLPYPSPHSQSPMSFEPPLSGSSMNRASPPALPAQSSTSCGQHPSGTENTTPHPQSSSVAQQPNRTTLLLLEESVIYRFSLSQISWNEGHAVFLAAAVDDVYSMLNTPSPPEVIFVDSHMCRAHELVVYIKEHYPDTVLVWTKERRDHHANRRELSSRGKSTSALLLPKVPVEDPTTLPTTGLFTPGIHTALSTENTSSITTASNLGEQSIVIPAECAGYLNKPYVAREFRELLANLWQRIVSKEKVRQQIAHVREIFTEHHSCPWQRGECIGQGRFGTVYAATNTLTGGKMAVKIIPLNLESANAEEQAMELLNEIELMRTLEHENILHYFYCERTEDTINIFMEYAAGGSLAKQIERSGPVPLQQAAHYTQQLLKAVAYIHKRNIVHRDIKGGNLLLSRGALKLGDFGSARRCVDDDMLTSTVGTVRWMAPEVARGDPYDQQCDIWSVGCAVLEMLTGRPPFAHIQGTSVQVVSHIASLEETDTVTQPLLHLSTVSVTSCGGGGGSSSLRCAELACTFVRQCLQVDPTMRPSAETLLTHPFVTNTVLAGHIMAAYATCGEIGAVPAASSIIPAAGKVTAGGAGGVIPNFSLFGSPTILTGSSHSIPVPANGSHASCFNHPELKGTGGSDPCGASNAGNREENEENNDDNESEEKESSVTRLHGYTDVRSESTAFSHYNKTHYYNNVQVAPGVLQSYRFGSVSCAPPQQPHGGGLVAPSTITTVTTTSTTSYHHHHQPQQHQQHSPHQFSIHGGSQQVPCQHTPHPAARVSGTGAGGHPSRWHRTRDSSVWSLYNSSSMAAPCSDTAP